MTANVTLKHN